MDILRDPVSSASHFLTAFLALIATVFLLRITTWDRRRWVCVLIFGTCMTSLYLASGLYHALRLPSEELRFFQLLDMSAIYLMIAGSATPMAVLLTTGWLRVLLVVGEWLLAAIGICCLWVFPLPDLAVLIACYMGMAWLSCAGIHVYWRATGWRGMRWYLAAVGCYLLGAIVELAGWPILWAGVIRSHELLHFCDIGGTACYLVFLVHYVLPYYPLKVVKPSRAARRAAAVSAPARAA